MTVALPYPVVVTDDGQGLDAQGVQGNFDALASGVPVVRPQAVGNGTWEWPGGSVKSQSKTVSHNLGRVPGFVGVTPNQTQGATEVLSVETFNYTATTFETRARFVTTIPAAGASASFVWIAVG